MNWHSVPLASRSLASNRRRGILSRTRRTCRWFLLSLLLLPRAEAQLLSPGVRMGSVLSENLRAGANASGIYGAEKQNFVIGPSLEVRLPLLLAVEVDALYRTWDYRFAGGQTGQILSGRGEGSGWEIPVLGKFRMPLPLVKPFVSTGISFLQVTSSKYRQQCVGAQCLPAFSFSGNAPELRDDSSRGWVLGAGADVKLGLRFTPELRYTRWFDRVFSTPGLRSNQNQVQFLVGISY